MTKEAGEFQNQLVLKNPDSAYSWNLLEKLNSKFKKDELIKNYNAAKEAKNINEAFLYHALLLLQNKDFDKRDDRVDSIGLGAKEINAYKEFERKISKFRKSAKYKNEYKRFEKYFLLGGMDSITRELSIIPDESDIQNEKNIIISDLSKRYNNHYLAFVTAVAIFKYYNIKENLFVMPEDIISRVLPNAFSEYVEKISEKKEIEKNILYSIIKAESAFNHKAVSSAGAVGLMQLMPETAKGIAKTLGLKKYDLKSPKTSVTFGVSYLLWLKKVFNGDFDKYFEDIVAGYNAGPGNVRKWHKEYKYEDTDSFTEFIPFEETRGYILKTKKFLMQYRLLNSK